MYHVIHLQLKITSTVFHSVVTFEDLGEFLRHFTHEILNQMKQWYDSFKGNSGLILAEYQLSAMKCHKSSLFILLQNP